MANTSTSFVRTPIGVIMHVDNHRALVKLATSKGQLLMLEPATPIDHTVMFGLSDHDPGDEHNGSL